MKKLMTIALLFISLSVFADEDHDHEHDEKHEEESSAVVGPQKGILAKGELGFQLSPEALKAFGLKYQTAASGAFEIPLPGLVEVKKDRFIYRVRDGWIRRVAVQVLSKTQQTVTIRIIDFHAGDQIIVHGAGFVRTAELVVEEGVSHGHSH